jgi:hypothetical protein
MFNSSMWSLILKEKKKKRKQYVLCDEVREELEQPHNHAYHDFCSHVVFLGQ